MAAKKGLNMGKGLEALFPQSKKKTAVTAESPSADTVDNKASSTEKTNVKAENTANKTKSDSKVVDEPSTSKSSAKTNEKRSTAKSTEKADSTSSASKTTTKATTKSSSSKSTAKTSEAKSSTKTAAKGNTTKTTTKAGTKATTSKSAAKSTTKATTSKSAVKNNANEITAKTGETAAEIAGNTTVGASDAIVNENASNIYIAELQNTNGLNGHTELRLTEIVPNKEQPRRTFTKESIEELSDSIRQFGILQPLLVQKKGKYYELIAGERRWRAAKAAGLKKVPAIIRDFTEQEAMEISLIENIQREDLNVIEEAQAYQRLLDEFHLKQEELAERVSKSRSAITNALRLLKLDTRIQEMLIKGDLSMGHARALLPIDDQEQQYTIALKVVSEKLSVRDVERLIKQLQTTSKIQKKKEPDTQLKAVFESLEQKLQKITGTKVSINHKRGNKGKIEIEYYSQDDLERIIDLIS